MSMNQFRGLSAHDRERVVAFALIRRGLELLAGPVDYGRLGFGNAGEAMTWYLKNAALVDRVAKDVDRVVGNYVKRLGRGRFLDRWS
jgi:hypothetical protein